MWNKLKGFLGFLFVAGCIMVWLSFIPVSPLETYSRSLEWYGLLLLGFASLAFFIVLILHGINQYLYRFKPEPRRVVWRSKRVTRAVAAIFILTLLITGFGWGLARPYLLALGALSLDEVVKNPKLYENEKISVVGYYFRWPLFGEDGFILSTSIYEAPTSWDAFVNLMSGAWLSVKLPPGTKAYTGQKYVFTGVIEMKNYLDSEIPILKCSSIVPI